ncbi:MAG: hypothetical protein H0W39_06755 [Sphingomonas sp.]|nr:hypothetical protein [Sphingomonas sp.]
MPSRPRQSVEDVAQQLRAHAELLHGFAARFRTLHEPNWMDRVPETHQLQECLRLFQEVTEMVAERMDYCSMDLLR